MVEGFLSEVLKMGFVEKYGLIVWPLLCRSFVFNSHEIYGFHVVVRYFTKNEQTE